MIDSFTLSFFVDLVMVYDCHGVKTCHMCKYYSTFLIMLHV